MYTKYYWTKYNLQIDLDNKRQLLYNSISNVFWELNEDAISELDEVKALISQNKYDENHPSHEMLMEANIISPYSDNEITDILKTKRLFKQANNSVLLTIAPTTDCNFRCPYCFESIKKKVYMSDEVLENIQNYIFKYPKDKTIELNWIGGEPLLAFDKIKKLSLKLKDNNYKYRNTIITNGYLLDKIIEDIEDLYIKSIQVTIDGLGEVHNKMRPHKTDKDSFSKIISNLELLKNIKKEKLEVSIRVNINKNNCDSFKQLYDFLHSKFPNFLIYPSAIQEKNDGSGKHNCLFDRKELTNYILKYKETYGEHLMPFFPDMNEMLCMAETIHGYLISADGSIYKCWEDIGLKERIIGELNENGIDITNHSLISRYLCGVSPFEMEPCMSCPILPQCIGSCPLKRMRKKFQDSSYDCCPYFKDNLETFLKLHYYDKTNALK